MPDCKVKYLALSCNDDLPLPCELGPVKKKPTFGYFTASPAQYGVARRFGRVRRRGPGISALILPVIDRWEIVPCSSNRITFCAEQITAENQGVQVNGFAVWKIGDPEKAGQCYDFDDERVAIEALGENLRDVVESTIRHRVANMPLEEVLRKRGSIILQLKEETAYMASQWGVTVETVEIREVLILSKKLFEQMQAGYRNAMRLKSETSALETDQAIQERKLAQEEELALLQQDAAKRDLERSAEMKRLTATEQAALDDFRREIEVAAIPKENGLRVLRAAQDLAKAEDKERVAAIEDRVERALLATRNSEDRLVATIRELGTAVAGMRVNTLNLGEDVLGRLLEFMTAKASNMQNAAKTPGAE